MEVRGKRCIKRKVMNDLVEGYEVAMKLQAMIHGGGGISDRLVDKILNSFDEVISTLSSSEPMTEVDGGSCDDSVPASAGFDRRFHDSGESRKTVGTRKLKTQSVVSEKLEDDFAWRKYGQKQILNAKFPRNYFRCTQKNTQGCKALKQVQKLQDDPQSYQVTYIGSHSCIPIPTKTEPEPVKTEPEPTKTEPSEMNISSITSNSSSFIFTNPMVMKQEETTNGGHSDVVEDAGDLSLVWGDILRSEGFGTPPMYSYSEVMNAEFSFH